MSTKERDTTPFQTPFNFSLLLFRLRVYAGRPAVIFCLSKSSRRKGGVAAICIFHFSHLQQNKKCTYFYRRRTFYLRDIQLGN